MLILVKLQAEAYNFTKINTPAWVFFTFFKLYKWYQIAQCITYTHVPCGSCKKVAVCFTIISNLTVTTRISANNVREVLFLERIFVTEQRIQLAWWLENKFNLAEVYVILYRVNWTSSRCRTRISSFLEAFSTTFFFHRNFIYVLFLLQKLTKFFG